LPQASVAVQVLVKVPVPEQALGTKTVTKVTGETVLQTSVAVGVLKIGVAGQLTGLGCVGQEMPGGDAS
jgi:hypothetical protein